MKYSNLLVSFSVLFLAGCQTDKPHVVTTVPPAAMQQVTYTQNELDQKISEALAANEASHEAELRRSQNLRSNNDAALLAFGKGAFPFVGLTLDNSDLWLQDVQDDPLQTKQWQIAFKAYDVGGIDMARGTITDMQKVANDAAEERGHLQEQLDIVNEALAKAQNDLQQAIVSAEEQAILDRAANEQTINDLQASFNKKIAEAQNENIKNQQRFLNILAIGCAVAALLCAWQKIFALAGLLGLVGAPGSLALSQLAGKSWFLPVAVSLGGICLIIGLVIAIKTASSKKAAKSLEAQRLVTQSAFNKIRSRLDDLYEMTTTKLSSYLTNKSDLTVSEFVDDQIFAQANMTDEEKAEIHRLRMVAKQSSSS